MSNIESEFKIYKNRQTMERGEVLPESSEKKEGEEEKKMAARERAEQFSREVQNTKKQVQHILVNMQQVVQAVRMIREQLGLGEGRIPSVGQDEKNLVKLRKKLLDFNNQMDDLKKALEQEEERAVREEYPDWTDEALSTEAARRVVELLQKLGL